jgi:predicted ATP-dependent serine protease
MNQTTSIFWHADQVDPEWRHRSEQKRWDHQEARREQQARQQQGQHQEKKADGKPRRLNLLNTTGWDSKPAEEPEYEVANRIPTKQVTLFSGEGGAGKSILCMQLMVATVLQRPWLGTTPRQGPALFIEAEDGESIIHYRMQKLLQHYDSSLMRCVLNSIWSPCTEGTPCSAPLIAGCQGWHRQRCTTSCWRWRAT